jgi:lipopolysaccharide export system protein LptA
MEGNVVVIQGGSTLTAEKVRAEYTEDRSEIKHIIATGNVVLLSGEDIAKGDRADYYLLENTVVLTGNAYVKQGTDTMTAQRITMNTITGAAEMTGRVTTVLTPKKDEEGKKSE